MDYSLARRHMVESQVRPNDVTNLQLQAAMEEIPREVFLPVELKGQAYVEREITYEEGRWLLRARDFAKLVNAAEPRSGDLVLNVVCGSGYSTAILAQLTEMVVSIESNEGMATLAQENLTKLDVSNAAVITGDPVAGAASQGPFDLIFVGGATEIYPEQLLAQLKDGGRLATIVRKDGISRGVIYQRNGEAVSCTESFDAATSAILPGFAASKGFTF